MRDRLIEILRKYKHPICDGLVAKLPNVEAIVDHLLAEGVIVPPCKAGNDVYVLTHDAPTGIEKSRVKRMSLIELQDGTSIRIIVPCVFDDWGNSIWEFYPEDFGKKVFLTREEAEKALAEREGNG